MSSECQPHPYSGLPLDGQMAAGKDVDPMRLEEEQWKERLRNTDGLGDSRRVLKQTDYAGVLWWRPCVQICAKRTK